ncbi:hypothetical protein D9758_004966 [Tetrapyrgos nigripes]|uniref:Uncharacterized protein n=1 Tax=Tetrapyrgos nigripes TaxID=182062 RepID=A0A8H5GWA7_9AGAR|nr:hypothetical protein D9758_004966 [Tetrapyrgos nigripes]
MVPCCGKYNCLYSQCISVTPRQHLLATPSPFPLSSHFISSFLELHSSRTLAMTHLQFVTLLSILPLVTRSLEIHVNQPFPSITPGAQISVTWQRDTSGPHQDPSNWNLEFLLNNAEPGPLISVSNADAQSGSMTVTIPPFATPGQPIQLVAIDDKHGSTFATFPKDPVTVQSALSSKVTETGSETSASVPSTSISPTHEGEAGAGARAGAGAGNFSSTPSDTGTSSDSTTSNETTSIFMSLPTSMGSGENGSVPVTDSSLSVLPTRTSDISTTPAATGDSGVDASPPIAPPIATTTSPNDTASSFNGHHTNRAAIIAGSVGGGLALILLLTFIYCFWRRRQTKRQFVTESDHTSFDRDMMIRSNSDTVILSTGDHHDLKPKTSDMFKFEPLSASTIGVALGQSRGLGSEKANEKAQVKLESHRSSSSVSSARSSTSVDDEETTPSLVRYSSGKDEIRSQAITSIYSTPYTPISKNHTRIPARTDRQMDIQGQIMDLQQRMIGKSGTTSAKELNEIRENIKHLEELHKTDWALELTDVPPPGLGTGLDQRRNSVGVAL